VDRGTNILKLVADNCFLYFSLRLFLFYSTHFLCHSFLFGWVPPSAPCLRTGIQSKPNVELLKDKIKGKFFKHLLKQIFHHCHPSGYADYGSGGVARCSSVLRPHKENLAFSIKEQFISNIYQQYFPVVFFVFRIGNGLGTIRNRIQHSESRESNQMRINSDVDFAFHRAGYVYIYVIN
jgi:hypothetical protein